MLSERSHVATPCAQRALKAERCLGTIAAISTAAVGSVIVSVTALVDTAASAVAALNQPAEELVDDPTFAHTSEVNAHARVRLGARGSGCIKAELVPARDTAQLVHACGWERASRIQRRRPRATQRCDRRVEAARQRGMRDGARAQHFSQRSRQIE